MGNGQEVVLDFIEAINNGDLEGVTALMSEDYVFVDHSGSEHRGREKMREAWRHYLRNWPDYRIHVREILKCGKDSFAVLGATTGSHVGEDVESNETVLWLADVSDGKVTLWRMYA